MTGQDVFYLRKAADLSQEQMAGLLDISKRTYERIEREEGRALKKTEQLMLMLWWQGLVRAGLSLRLMSDPVRGQWWIEGSMKGTTWKALGPYEERHDAARVMKVLDGYGRAR